LAIEALTHLKSFHKEKFIAVAMVESFSADNAESSFGSTTTHSVKTTMEGVVKVDF